MKTLHILLVIFVICSVAVEVNTKRYNRRRGRERPPKRLPSTARTTTEPTTAAPIERDDPSGMKHKPQFTVNGPVPDAPPIGGRDGSTSRREVPGNARTRGTVVGPQTLGSNRLSNEQQQILLQAHNDFRGLVRPTAANMVALQWDNELANMAQMWADQCLFMHGGTNSGGRYGWIGQNLWVGSGTQWDMNGMVESWFNEHEHYTFANGNCHSVCGHYTQVVWAETKFVGCALQTCPYIQGLNGWSPATILVCNYAEGGNYIGMKPYVSGVPCSQCPTGYTSCIDEKLCGLPEQVVPDSGSSEETGGIETPQIPHQPVGGGSPGSNPGPEAGDNSGGSTDNSGRQTSCGGTLVASAGEIASPNWPTPYTSNLRCEWVIRGKKDQTVTLQVTYMDIEAERHCSWDFLQVKPNGASGSSTKYCGNLSPSPMMSHGNEMVVIFHSDESVNKGGFMASYRLNGGEAEKETAPVCGGAIHGKKGTIKSPNYPREYDNNLDCLWNIEVASNKRVRLTFKAFEIEENAVCDHDRVTVRLGNERIPMVFCGNEKPNGNIISLSNRMEIRLVTDGSNNRRGFSATWRAI